MPLPKIIGMPENLDVGPNYTLRVTAIDPTTGSVVAGTTSSIVVIEANAVGSNVEDLAVGGFQLVPGPGDVVPGTPTGIGL